MATEARGPFRRSFSAKEIEAVVGTWLEKRDQPVSGSRAQLESIPDWLDQLGVSELGEVWDRVLPILNQPAPQFLRVNRLKAEVSAIVKSLKSEDIEVEFVQGDCLKLLKRANVFRSSCYLAGGFEMQDLSSQQVAPFTMVQKGQRVVDACAGGGGKSLLGVS